MRNSLAVKADNKEVDAWFETMDTDGGGSLDLSELKAALKRIADAAAGAEAEAAGLRADARAMGSKAAAIEEVAAATEVLDPGLNW